MGLGKNAGKSAVSAAAAAATPALGSGYIRSILERAIDGFGPLRPAAQSATAHLVKNYGVVDAAVKSLIRFHVTLAGAEGFVTNFGG